MFSEADRTSPLIGAIDQGTSSSRFLIFAANTGTVLAQHQIELKHAYPREGWVEMDPKMIVASVFQCIDEACGKLQEAGFDPKKIRAVGITNQRETSIVWDRSTGEPIYNAVVWLDMRTEQLADEFAQRAGRGGKDAWRSVTGLPIHPYFSALKIRWILDNCGAVESTKKKYEAGQLCAGTVDAWLIWNLTDRKSFVTDVTNASRTNLMNLRTQTWDDRLLRFYNIRRDLLPEIRSSAEVYGTISRGACVGVPIAGCLGDQQAALVGEGCLRAAEAKSTYGTGYFMLMNTGTKVAISKYGLLTTVGYKMGPNAPTVYALEGSAAVAGIVIRWLRDQLAVIGNPAESETLARQVDDTGGVYFVPAFSGLYAPYWNSKARGLICGLTQFSTKAHVVRAALESTCYQTREVVDAMSNDTGLALARLKVDGGMVRNNLLMQMMADILGKTVVRPRMAEASSLGAAAAAGHAVGVWELDRLAGAGGGVAGNAGEDIFQPTMTETERRKGYEKWKAAVHASISLAAGGGEGGRACELFGSGKGRCVIVASAAAAVSIGVIGVFAWRRWS